MRRVRGGINGTEEAMFVSAEDQKEMGAGEFSQRGADVRRKRRSGRRLKKGLYRLREK